MSRLYRFTERQIIDADLQTVWDFISSPKNLQKITPGDMAFYILNDSADGPMYPGMIISYKVAPLLGIKLSWVTEITHVKNLEYFVDEQRFGPFAFWHHKHFIKEVNGQVEMVDIVDYKIPFGFLGDMVNSMMIKKRLKDIFLHRRRAIAEEFK